MNNRIIIIDGNSLLNRAYYAMQRPMITKEGLYTQGVYGFLNMLQKIKRDYESGYIAVAFDRKAPTFRHLEFEDYKAGRKKMPPELAMQLPLLKEVLEAMGIQILEIDGFEADDIIGTVSRVAEENGLTPLIITGDKDELQLASQTTKVIITKKGISEFEIYDYDAMVESYGFSPTQFIDYKGLMGDPSDNIPGLPGVGEKTARKLVIEYGSIENLLEHVEEIKNERLRQIIEDNQQQARMSKRLATIVREVPIEVDFADYRWEAPDQQKLIELYLKLEFNSFLKKLTPETAPSPTTPVAKTSRSTKDSADDQLSFEGLGSVQNSKTSIDGDSHLAMIDGNNSLDHMPTPLGLIDFEKQVRTGEEVSIKVFSDGSHVSIPKILGIALLAHDKFYFIEPDDTAELVRILMDNRIRLMGHDLKEDYYPLFWAGMTHFNTGYDTAIAQYLLDSSRSNYSLKVLAQEYCRKELTESDDLKAKRIQLVQPCQPNKNNSGTKNFFRRNEPNLPRGRVAVD
jgi:DNA polymerase I